MMVRLSSVSKEKNQPRALITTKNFDQVCADVFTWLTSVTSRGGVPQNIQIPFSYLALDR